MSKNYKIYMHKNKINGKIYIGKTKRSLNARWKSNGEGYKTSPHMWNAIQKYGWDNFEHYLLQDEIESEEELNRLEKEYIKLYNSTNPNIGYNIDEGGSSSSSLRYPVYQYDLNGMFISEFLSARDAAEQFDGNIDSITKKIQSCCKGKRKSCHGFQWSYIKKDNIGEIKKQHRGEKDVYQYNLNLEQIGHYNSAAEASIKTGISTSIISYACNKKIRTGGGFIWSFDKIDKDTYDIGRKDCIPVYQYTIDNVFVKKFKSMEDAANDVGVTSSSISSACCGRQKTCAGFIWSKTPIV